MSVHVSIHDVSPAWESEFEFALSLCHAAGVKPALLVVPNFHGRAPLLDCPKFVERLRTLEKDGHEVLLHGYYHRSGFAPLADALPQAKGNAAPTGLRRMFAQKVVSASEAEFSDVSEAEARRRIDDGKRVLRDAGLSPVGFVPPAWSMPPWMLDVLRDEGFTFTEDHVFAYRLGANDKRASRKPSLVLNYASRTPSRLLSSVAWVRVSRPIERLLPARAALHPADMRVRFLRTETESLLGWAKGRGFLPTVASVLA